MLALHPISHSTRSFHQVLFYNGVVATTKLKWIQRNAWRLQNDVHQVPSLLGGPPWTSKPDGGFNGWKDNWRLHDGLFCSSALCNVQAESCSTRFLSVGCTLLCRRAYISPRVWFQHQHSTDQPLENVMTARAGHSSMGLQRRCGVSKNVQKSQKTWNLYEHGTLQV
jgi:hypothetical protein